MSVSQRPRVTDEHAAQFREEGYTTCPGFLDAHEVAALQAEVRRLRADGLLRNVATEGDGETISDSDLNLQLVGLSRISDLFRALPYEAKVVDAISQLIGVPFVRHLDQVFLKPAGHGTGTSWHTDNAYFTIADPLMGTAMWIAVHDATEANGTLRVIPGGFRETFDHSRDPYSDHHIRCYPDEERAVTCELEAGGVVFFCYGTPHSTGRNTTDTDRAGVGYHFLRTDFVPESYGGATAWGPLAHLTGPDATGGLAEHGVRVAGTWPDEVARVLS
jgi:phytanoyl-CoA hydroxylase